MTKGGDQPCDWSTFGKAFYGKQASYWVFPEWLVITYNFLWQATVAGLHAGPIIASIYLTAMVRVRIGEVDLNGAMVVNPVYLLLLPIFCGVYFGSMLVFLFIDWFAKWTLLGRRKPGSYSWLESSYCQRWQIYLTINEIRQSVSFGGGGILDFFTGTQFLVWWFRALGSHIGNRVNSLLKRSRQGSVFRCACTPTEETP